jgi:hypothetical protein
MHIIPIFKHALMITFFVFVMMLLVDFVDIISKNRISAIIRGGKFRQYSLASFLGATPGCLGGFMNVTLYIHGMISFGALVGGMIATSGDEAFVMLTQFPGTALALFGLLFVLGIPLAWLSDKIIKHLEITPSVSCENAYGEDCSPALAVMEKDKTIFRPINFLKNPHSFSFARFLLVGFLVFFISSLAIGAIGPSSWNWERITFLALSMCALYIIMVCSDHYLEFHVWRHIIKQHLFRIFLWSLGALFLLHWGLSLCNLDTVIHEHMLWVLVIGALIGIIPESGPHLVFVMMYAQGLVPFSVLFTSSFVQDGHAILPMLSYSIKDSIIIKTLNLIFGLAIGGTLFYLGF